MGGRRGGGRREVTGPGRAPEAWPKVTDLGARRLQARRRHQLNIFGLRLLVAAVVLGSWEGTTRLGIVDQFFFGQPSGVVHQLWVWITDETALGPLWLQVLTTLEETVGGFVVGSVLGVVFGILLGRNALLAEVFSIYIKAANAIPRVVLAALFAISLGLDLKSKIATAAVLVFFVVCFNA